MEWDTVYNVFAFFRLTPIFFFVILRQLFCLDAKRKCDR
jgi:hypothetical protein